MNNCSCGLNYKDEFCKRHGVYANECGGCVQKMRSIRMLEEQVKILTKLLSEFDATKPTQIIISQEKIPEDFEKVFQDNFKDILA